MYHFIPATAINAYLLVTAAYLAIAATYSLIKE